MLQTKIFYKATNDSMFKAIYTAPHNKYLLKGLLEKCLQKKIEIIKIYSPEIFKKNIRIKNKTLDVLVKADDKLINIELNNGYYYSLHRRNAAYIFEKYSEATKVGESYNKMVEFIQINFTSGLPDSYPSLGIYTLSDKKTKKDFIDNIKIYEFNIDKIKKACYNGDKRYDFVAALDYGKQELEQFCKGDKYMEAFKKEVERLNDDAEFREFLSEERETELLKNTLISEAHEEGKEQGIIMTAKNMLKEGLNIDMIMKITGLSQTEIEKIKEKNC